MCLVVAIKLREAAKGLYLARKRNQKEVSFGEMD